MKKIRSYTSIQSVEKAIHAINDLQLPFPITLTQMIWFTVPLFAAIIFGSLSPLSLIDGALFKYLGTPVVLTWLMYQKTFDGKKPYGSLKSIVTYALRPKIAHAGKQMRLNKGKMNESTTIVRSEQLSGIPH